MPLTSIGEPGWEGNPVTRPADPSLRVLRSQAIGRIFRLIGSYQGLSRIGAIHTVRAASRPMCEWILTADAEELRASLTIAGCFGYPSDVSFAPLPSQLGGR
jgi:hypothetical protein